MELQNIRNKQDWTLLFSSEILARGKVYWEDGAVINLVRETDAHRYTAAVAGSRNYCVSIRFSANGKIVSGMSCDCPYVETGNACKHMAAVLYAIDATKIQSSAEKDGSSSDAAEAVNHLDEKTLRTILIEAAENDPDLWERISFAYDPKTVSKHLSQWKKQITSIVNNAKDRYGFVENLFDLTCSLNDFLDKKSDVLIKLGEKEAAFKLICAAYEKVANTDGDDSNGEYVDFFCECVERWDELLENSDLSLRRAVYPWFETHDGDNLYETAFDYIFDAFTDEEFLRKQLVYLDRLIDETDPTRDYRLRMLVMKRLGIMERLYLPKEELTAYRKQYHAMPDVRKQEITLAMDSKCYEEAESLLRESLVLDGKFAGLVDDHRKRLLELYEISGQEEKYRNELMDYVLESSQRELTYILKLKEITPSEEWEVLRENILTNPKQDFIRYELLAREGLFRRLFDMAAAKRDVTVLLQYETELKKRFPDEMRDVLLAKAEADMEKAMNRKQYADAIRYLKHVLSYPEGKRKAQELAQMWMERYRRPAMVDELAKAGI